MKNYGKVIGFIFLLLSFYSLPSHALAEDSSSPGPQWQEIPAYGPELKALADWQGTSADNTTDNDVEQTFYNASSDTGNVTGGLGNMLGGLMGGTGTSGNTSTSKSAENTWADIVTSEYDSFLDSIPFLSEIPFIGDRELVHEDILWKTDLAYGEGPTLNHILVDYPNVLNSASRPINSPGNMLRGLTGSTGGNLFGMATSQNNTNTTAANSVSNTATLNTANSSSNTKTTPKLSTTTSGKTKTATAVVTDSTKNNGATSLSSSGNTADTSAKRIFGLISGALHGEQVYRNKIQTDTPIANPSVLYPGTPTLKTAPTDGAQTYVLSPEEVAVWSTLPDNRRTFNSAIVTADFDPCKPGLETRYYSPLVIDTDRSGAIALDGGTIPFDIAPHLAGLEPIPVPAPGKDMFLVWDKAGTETIEGAAREYKEGEIVDITELFGPEDYTRSDFSVLAYADDGFTKLRKLCDVDNDGDVDKQDTALSAEVSAKLKLWSPLSGQLILFKDTDIVIDTRAGSYERHPSDIEGWAVEYKMKDNQDKLVGYEWLTSKSSSLLCMDVLLAIQ